MNYKPHFKAGMLGSTLITPCFLTVTKDPVELACIFGLALYGSLFIDLDTHSKPSQFTALALTVFGVWGIVMKEPYLPLFFTTSFCLVKIFNHRTWIHTYLIPALAFFLAYWFNSMYFVAFGLGNIVHLIVDKIFPWCLDSWVKKIRLPTLL